MQVSEFGDDVYVPDPDDHAGLARLRLKHRIRESYLLLPAHVWMVNILPICMRYYQREPGFIWLWAGWSVVCCLVGLLFYGYEDYWVGEVRRRLITPMRTIMCVAFQWTLCLSFCYIWQ